MGINTQIATTAVLALAIAGCTIGGDTPEATQPANPSPNPAEKPETTKTKEPFPNPVVSPKSEPAIKANNPGLFESTKGDLRADLTRKGRPDPFGEIVQPLVPQMSTSTQQTEVPKLPPLPTPSIKPPRQIGQTTQPGQPGQSQSTVPGGQKIQPSKTNSSTTKPKPVLTPVIPKILPQVLTKEPVKPVLPPAPKPEDAQAIAVRGVVLIGKEAKAIIEVPNEMANEKVQSRYVQAGQRLGNGVLIKRIEMNSGSEPIVILEQYGIEVAKRVEDKSKTEQSKTASAGSSIDMSTPL
jgi:hypothetical protein